MAPLFLEVVVRALLIAAGTSVVLWALRIKTAAVRHAAWMAVVVAMLLLPLWSLGGPKVWLPVLEPAPSSVIAPDSNVTDAAVPDISPSGSLPTSQQSALPDEAPAEPLNWQGALAGVYLFGAIVLLMRLVVGTVQAERLRRDAVVESGLATSSRCATPITVGFFRPLLILPAAWQKWPAAQLDAVLTHEREHARRHDPLAQWLALFNRAVFWFHPLAWWLERRLSTLAEEACDAAVIAAGHSPQDYSEYLLDMARSLTRQGRRLNVVGMAMPGSSLPRRMRQMFDGLPMQRTSRARVICTVVLCAISSMIFAAGALTAQTPAIQAKFDVISIKPCPGLTQRPLGSGRSSPPWDPQLSPGYVHWDCVSLAELADLAFAGGGLPPATFPSELRLLNVLDRPRPDSPKRVRGGPSWVESDRFAIEVKMSGDVTDLTDAERFIAIRSAILPPLRVMLEDRFQLKLRKATEQQPMYAMTIAKGGLKITQTAPQKCWQRPPNTRPADATPPPGFEGTPSCSFGVRSMGRNGNQGYEIENGNLADFAKWLSGRMDRYVLDKTSTEGRFSFKFEYAPDDSTPGDAFDAQRERARLAAGLGLQPANPQGRPQPDGPTIFKALEALGLKLEPTKGQAEYLVIESVQKPRPDAPAVASNTSSAESPDGSLANPGAFQQQAAGGTPVRQKFEVAAIKACEPEETPTSGARGSAGGTNATFSPGRFFVPCVTTEQLIYLAYASYGARDDERLANDDFGTASNAQKVRGGPAWVHSTRDKYSIEASGPGATERTVLMGAMLQRLLEDRFHLKLHRDTEEVPLFGLTVSKGGFKLKPMKDGDCDNSDGPPDPNAAKPLCGNLNMMSAGGITRWSWGSGTMAGLASQLSRALGTHVIDQTEITDKFVYRFEFTHGADMPETESSVSAALEDQLGLKLVRTKGPRGFLVIDHIERPTPDSPIPARATGAGSRR